VATTDPSLAWETLKMLNEKILCSSLAVMFVLISGCSPMLGIRPDPPETELVGPTCDPGEKDCEDFVKYLKYTKDLAESYRSRASLNRFSIYTANAVALVGLSLSAGLASANAGITALRIVPIVTGFTSALIALLDSPEKTYAYTTAANKLDTAQVIVISELSLEDPNYSLAKTKLAAIVTLVRNQLEDTRNKLATDEDDQKKLTDKLREDLDNALSIAKRPSVTVLVPRGMDFDLAPIQPGRTVDVERTRLPNNQRITLQQFAADSGAVTLHAEEIGGTTVTLVDSTGASVDFEVEVVDSKTERSALHQYVI